MTEQRTTRERMETAYWTMTGRTNGYGMRPWFRLFYIRRHPEGISDTSLRRWLDGDRPISQKALSVLEDIEAQSRDVPDEGA